MPGRIGAAARAAQSSRGAPAPSRPCARAARSGAVDRGAVDRGAVDRGAVDRL